MDLSDLKYFLAIIQPYLKYILVSMYAVFFLIINRIFIQDPVLRAWLLASLSSSPTKASGKSITAMVFVQLIAIATVAAIVYSPSHLLPEYFLISLLTFVGSLYGIKVASKYFNNSDTTNSTQTSSVTTTTENSSTVKKDPDKKDTKTKEEEEATKDSGDIG